MVRPPARETLPWPQQGRPSPGHRSLKHKASGAMGAYRQIKERLLGLFGPGRR